MQLHANPDFAAVALSALPFAPAIALRLAPPPHEGKRVGAQYLWRNRRRDDRNIGSASLHLGTGAWADFACKEDPLARGHGLISWVAYLYNVDALTAERWLGGMLGLNAVDPEAPPECALLTGDEQKLAAHISAQAEAATPSWYALDIPTRRSDMQGLSSMYGNIVKQHGNPQKVYAYRRAGGAAALIVLRWDTAAGKIVRPVIWARPATDEGAPARWVPAWPASIPLFQSDKISLKPQAPVLICEGEKAATAAEAIFPEHACSCIGGGLIARADWSLLYARDVTIWPDHDEAGIRTAEFIRQRAVAAGAAHVCAVAIPDHFPLKWDLADTPPPGWTPERLRQLAANARSPQAGRGPDLSILDLNRRPVPAPEDVLPSWSHWLATAAAAKSAPADYLLAALLGVASGLLGGRLWAEVRPGWQEPAVIWAVLVGDSAAGKSPALEAIEIGLEALERDLRKQFESEMLTWETEEEPDADERPVLHRARVDDTTVEAAAALLAREGRGLLAWAPELSGWISGLTRYRQAGANDRAFWLRCYDAKPASVDRKKLDEPLYIPVLAMSIVGGLQPDIIPQLLQAEFDDGLAARFLLTWPAPLTEPTAPDPKDWPAAEAHIAHAVSRLFHITEKQAEQHPLSGRVALTLRLSDGAQTRFLGWRDQYLADLRKRYGDAIPSFDGKAAGHVIRLASLLHALEWAASTKEDMPTRIDDVTMAAAIDLRCGFFAAHRDRAEMDAGEPAPEKLARTLARYLVEQRVETVDTASLRRHVRLPGLRTEARLRLALLELQAAGWLAAGTVIPRQDRDPLPAVVAIKSGVLAAANR